MRFLVSLSAVEPTHEVEVVSAVQAHFDFVRTSNPRWRHGVSVDVVVAVDREHDARAVHREDVTDRGDHVFFSHRI